MFSLVTVSRLQLSTIEYNGTGNSSLDDTMNEHYFVSGFSDEDFNLFCAALKTKYNISLDDASIKKLKHFCGRSPYMLSLFAEKIVNEFAENKKYDIDSIYEKLRTKIVNQYERIQRCLQNEKPKISDQTDGLTKVKRLVFGPKIGLTTEDIRVLQDIGYLPEKNNKHYAVSEDFTNYLKRFYTKDKDIKHLVNAVEELFEKLIKLETFALIKKFGPVGKTLDDIQYDILTKANINMTKIQSNYNKNKSNPVITKKTDWFDSLNFDDNTYLFSNNWEIFRKYFLKPKTLSLK